MRRHVVVALAVFIGAALLISLILFPSLLRDEGPLSSVTTATPAPSEEIVAENQLLGTTKWMLNLDKGTSTQIQAYASAPSIAPGQTMTFYVSTQNTGTRYTLSVYRMGWYGGAGARLMLAPAWHTGQAQGYYDHAQYTLKQCLSCLVDSTTGFVEARWRPSYSLKIPTAWTTGLYLAECIDEQGYQAFTPFDVRGNSHSRYVIVTPDTTNQAANMWGGASLDGSDGGGTQGKRATKVSFDRPYLSAQGTTQILNNELPAIRWLERQGYDLSYMSDVDLHEHPQQLLNHRAYLSLGDDAYWTKEMRDGVENARDHGVNLAFLGADVSRWQMRFEPDSQGRANRTIVCYKVSTMEQNLSLDPLYGIDNSRVTTQWRDPLVNRPENALVGVMFAGTIAQQSSLPWRLAEPLSDPLLHGTQLRANQTYGCGLFSSTWNRVFQNGFSPPMLHTLASSPPADNVEDGSNTTYYTAPSGAFVFAAGSISWAESLDSYRFAPPSRCSGSTQAVPGLQKLMSNVMMKLQQRHSPPLSVPRS